MQRVVMLSVIILIVVAPLIELFYSLMGIISTNVLMYYTPLSGKLVRLILKKCPYFINILRVRRVPT